MVKVASDLMEITVCSQDLLGVLLNLKTVLNNFISDSAAFQKLFEKCSIGIDSCLAH